MRGESSESGAEEGQMGLQKNMEFEGRTQIQRRQPKVR